MAETGGCGEQNQNAGLRTGIGNLRTQWKPKGRKGLMGEAEARHDVGAGFPPTSTVRDLRAFGMPRNFRSMNISEAAEARECHSEIRLVASRGRDRCLSKSVSGDPVSECCSSWARSVSHCSRGSCRWRGVLPAGPDFDKPEVVPNVAVPGSDFHDDSALWRIDLGQEADRKGPQPIRWIGSGSFTSASSTNSALEQRLIANTRAQSGDFTPKFRLAEIRAGQEPLPSIDILQRALRAKPPILALFWTAQRRQHVRLLHGVVVARVHVHNSTMSLTFASPSFPTCRVSARAHAVPMWFHTPGSCWI